MPLFRLKGFINFEVLILVQPEISFYFCPSSRILRYYTRPGASLSCKYENVYTVIIPFNYFSTFVCNAELWNGTMLSCNSSYYLLFIVPPELCFVYVYIHHTALPFKNKYGFDIYILLYNVPCYTVSFFTHPLVKDPNSCICFHFIYK